MASGDPELPKHISHARVLKLDSKHTPRLEVSASLPGFTRMHVGTTGNPLYLLLDAPHEIAHEGHVLERHRGKGEEIPANIEASRSYVRIRISEQH